MNALYATYILGSQEDYCALSICFPPKQTTAPAEEILAEMDSIAVSWAAERRIPLDTDLSYEPDPRALCRTLSEYLGATGAINRRRLVCDLKLCTRAVKGVRE